MSPIARRWSRSCSPALERRDRAVDGRAAPPLHRTPCSRTVGHGERQPGRRPCARASRCRRRAARGGHACRARHHREHQRGRRRPSAPSGRYARSIPSPDTDSTGSRQPGQTGHAAIDAFIADQPVKAAGRRTERRRRCRPRLDRRPGRDRGADPALAATGRARTGPTDCGLRQRVWPNGRSRTRTRWSCHDDRARLLQPLGRTMSSCSGT